MKNIIQEDLLSKKQILIAINNRIKDLSSTKEVQDYLELIQTPEVIEYLDLLQDQETMRTGIAKDIIKLNHNCNHKTLLINTEDPNYIFDNYDSFHYCTCLECGKRVCINLSNSVIYKTTNFKLSDLEKIQKRYQEEYKNTNHNERLVIINELLKRQKVKSKK